MTWYSKKQESRQKRILAVVSVVFVSLACFITIDSKIGGLVTIEEAMSMMDTKLNNFTKAVRAYPEIEEIAEEIKGMSDDVFMQYFQVYRFVKNNITYKIDDNAEEEYSTNDPLYTLEYGGDCENQAILALSIIKAMGNDNTYMVMQPNHICWGAWVGNSFRLYNCDPDSTILEMRKVGYAKTTA